MKDKKHEASFIPCGDSMERMEEIRDDELENVAGGTRPGVKKRDGVCSVCGCNAYNRIENGTTYLVCSQCGHKE